MGFTFYVIYMFQLSLWYTVYSCKKIPLTSYPWGKAVWHRKMSTFLLVELLALQIKKYKRNGYNIQYIHSFRKLQTIRPLEIPVVSEFYCKAIFSILHHFFDDPKCWLSKASYHLLCRLRWVTCDSKRVCFIFLLRSIYQIWKANVIWRK